VTLAKRLHAIMDAIFGRKPRVGPELRESELRFRQVTDHIREVFFLCDPELTTMYYVSPAYEEVWGRSCKSLYDDPKSFGDSMHEEDRGPTFQKIAPHGTIVPNDTEYRIVRPDGTMRWIRARAFPIHNEVGDAYRYAGIAEDITASKSAAEVVQVQSHALEVSNRRLSLLGEMTSLLQTVVRIEEAGAIVGGYMSQFNMGSGGALYLFRESRNSLDLLAHWGDLKLAERLLPDECWALRRGQPNRTSSDQPELRCKHARQVEGDAEYLCLPMMAEGGALGLLHVVFTDETQSVRDDDSLFALRMSEQLGLALANFRLREQLRLQAMQDSLTGLFNRRFLEVSLKREFARGEREKNCVAVAMLDIDHFKRYNDVHGHEAGDAVLRGFGELLIQNCRAVDLPCRFGGEEFAVVLPGATRESVAVWAERILKRVRALRVVEGGEALPALTVSIGIAFYPEHGKETVDVIHAADEALYAAKGAGRDRCVFSAEVPGATECPSQAVRDIAS
jgi:diguanylate cyclase (GGDEF)-like protein/PAS domain S-box-containing protein